MMIVNAKSLSEAFDCLEQGYRPAAGCTNLFVDMHTGKKKPSRLVGISDISALKVFKAENGHLVIGAGLTFTEMEHLLSGYPPFRALQTAVSRIGSRQIRNRATLGGNIADASPAADSLPALAALDADILLISRKGTRRLPLTEIMIHVRQTALAEDELILAVRLPLRQWRSFFYKASPGRGATVSTVSLAFAVLESDGRIEDARLAFGSVAPTVVRAAECESFLRGKVLADKTMAEASFYVDRAISPISDVRGSERYRRLAARNIVAHAARLLQTGGTDEW